VASEVKKAFYLSLLLRETKDVMNQSLKNAEDNFNNIKRLNEGERFRIMMFYVPKCR
jgi:hypothetical protein